VFNITVTVQRTKDFYLFSYILILTVHKIHEVRLRPPLSGFHILYKDVSILHQ